MSIYGIIDSIVGAAEAGAEIVTGVLNYQEVEKTNRENKAFSERLRQDQLAREAEQNRQQQQAFGLSQQQLGISSRGMAFQEKEAMLNRKEKLDETAYNRLQHAADRYATYLNNKQALIKNRLTPLMRN